MRHVMLILCLAAGCSDGHDDDVVDCTRETRDDDFVVGFEKMGEMTRVDFKIMATTPGIQVGGDNEWIVQLNTVTNGVVGAPLVGAQLTVTPFMPDHGHVAPKPVKIQAHTEAGQYKLSEINTWMPGLWETTIQVGGMGADKVVFKTCIPS